MNGQQDIWAEQAARAEARQEAEFFRRQMDGELNYLLACHASVSEVLNPEMLYLLRDNFKRDIYGTPLNIPWIAVSDLLLSNLCREIGYDTFEFHPYVRKVLYESLERNPRFGKQRLLELSDFLMAYIQPLLAHQSPAQRREARRQRWVALSISHPELAAEEVATEYLEYQEKSNRAGQGYIRRFLEKAPVRNTHLAVLERYVAGTNELAKGDPEKAEEMLQGLGDSLQFGEVRLALPKTKQKETEETADWELKRKRILELEKKYSLPGESQGILREAIHALNIEQELGLLHLTNVNRQRESQKFWDFFDAMEGIPVQFYFLPGSLRQMPNLFAERMAYELIHQELDDDLSSVFFRSDPDVGRIVVADLPMGRNLRKSQQYFQRFILNNFNFPSSDISSFEDFLNYGINSLSYNYVIFPFQIHERQINDHIFDYLAWIEDTFSRFNTGLEMPTFLFFFIVNIDGRNTRNGKETLSNLQRLAMASKRSALIEVFDPVEESGFRNWLMGLGERNVFKIEELIDIFVKGLQEKSQELYATERAFNMDDIARLQELIYQLHNQ